MWILHRGLRSRRIVPVVPAAVLAEAWRGGSGRQANLARLLAVCEIEPMTEDQAKAVGVLAGKAAHDDIVDVAVVEGAIRRGDAVVTSNEDHIRAIAQAAGRRLRVAQV
jgi:predicted nucleic acid-binding protein